MCSNFTIKVANSDGLYANSFQNTSVNSAFNHCEVFKKYSSYYVKPKIFQVLCMKNISRDSVYSWHEGSWVLTPNSLRFPEHHWVKSWKPPAPIGRTQKAKTIKKAYQPDILTNIVSGARAIII